MAAAIRAIARRWPVDREDDVRWPRCAHLDRVRRGPSLDAQSFTISLPVTSTSSASGSVRSTIGLGDALAALHS
jgi:hypothetical protein